MVAFAADTAAIDTIADAVRAADIFSAISNIVGLSFESTGSFVVAVVAASTVFAVVWFENVEAPGDRRGREDAKRTRRRSLNSSK